MIKFEKCQFGYIKHKRKYQLIKTLIWLAIIVILFITGIIINGTKNNICTVLASICALPFAKTAANFLMFLPYQPATKDLYSKVEQHNKNYIANYDCIFTSKEQVTPVQAIITTYNSICAYSNSQKVNIYGFENSLKDFMKQANHSVTVNIYRDENQFLKRIDYINSNEQNQCTEEQIEKMGKVNESMKVMCL